MFVLELEIEKIMVSQKSASPSSDSDLQFLFLEYKFVYTNNHFKNKSSWVWQLMRKWAKNIKWGLEIDTVE